MYIPPYFRIEDQAKLISLIEQYSFGTLVTAHEGGLKASHIPLLAEAGEPVRLVGHVARGNDQWRDLAAGAEALAVFAGPHAYVSPSWYESQPSVPTWNYAVVHVYGSARILHDEKEVASVLERTVAKYEAGQREPWPMDLPRDYFEKMMRGIVAFEITPTRFEGKFKMSQNRSEADREGVIAALGGSSDPEHRRLAEMMGRICAG